MIEALKFSTVVREKFIKTINDLTLEQINQIPDGFGNNIAWNFGHIVVSTYSLAFVASGIDSNLEIPYRNDFAKGSKPNQWITQEQIDYFKKEAFLSLDKIKNDFSTNNTQQINPYITQTFGLANDSKEAIMQCIAMHDSYHFGCVNMILKNIK